MATAPRPGYTQSVIRDRGDVARVGLVTAGTRGDVQPLLALGLELRRLGHEVRVFLNRSVADWVREHGLPVTESGERAAGEVFAAAARRTTRLPWPVGAVVELVRPKPGVRESLDELERFARDTDLVVCSEASSLALHAADALRLPCVYVRFFPGWPSRQLPPPVCPLDDLGPRGNRLAHVAYSWLLGLSGGPDVNRWRGARGLRRWSFTRYHQEIAARGWRVVVAVTRALFEPPADWDPCVEQTGAWFLDEPGHTPAELLAPAPLPRLLVSLGSNVGPRAARVLELLRATAPLLPCRLVFTERAPTDAARWDGDVTWIGPTPHHLVLPHVAAVLHHAGAGTTAQVVRAARPSATIPMHGEQRFWARRLARRGLGPPPLDWQRATPRDLREAVIQALDAPRWEAALVQAATIVGQEAGVGCAQGLVERALSAAREAS